MIWSYHRADTAKIIHLIVMCDYIIVHIITNHHSKLDQYTSCFRSVLSQYLQNLAQIAVVEREMLVTRPGQSWTVSVERLLSSVLVSVRCVKPGNSRTESDRAGPGIDVKTKPARQDRTGKHYTPIDMVLSRDDEVSTLLFVSQSRRDVATIQSVVRRSILHLSASV